MSVGIEDYCVGCPQGCIHCGRKNVVVVRCDGFKCDEYTTDPEEFYSIGDKDYCPECAKEFLEEDEEDE